MSRHLMLLAFAVPALAVAQGTGAPPTVAIASLRAVPRDVADTVAAIFNRPATRRYAGDHVVGASERVAGDLAVLDGTLTIEGQVRGRVVALNGTVALRSGARVDGDVIVIGGRVDSRDGGIVDGSIRVYGTRVRIDHGVGRITVSDVPEEPAAWYRRPNRWRNGLWSDLRLVSARTYNRVEGLPILVGPVVGRDVGWGRITLEALGVVRTVDKFDWSRQKIGHSVRAEVQFGTRGGIRVGGRLFDEVKPVEPWHLSDTEVGLAAFFLRRDFRDYYDQHGGGLYGALFLGPQADLTFGYSDERWGPRATRDPFTLFRGGQEWRPNPVMDAGTFHLLTATLRYDTRNDRDDPWSGWFITANYEYGTGTIDAFAPTSPLVRRPSASGRVNYDRALIDVRSYNRFSPDGQLNLRLVLGGWLSGDELPLQRRFSLGGPGDLSGFDFRRPAPTADELTCAVAAVGAPSTSSLPAGVPAQCERVALAQVEYRGEIHIDPFGLLGAEQSSRRSGWGRRAEWVVFADAGRGWLVGRRIGDVQYGASDFPPLSSFQGDVGVGLRLDDLGVYAAKAVTGGGAPVNFFIRLSPRF